MSSQEPRRAQSQPPPLTALPRVEDIPVVEQGYDRARVQEAFEGFRRHVTSLQAHLRVLQAAPRNAQVEPVGHAARMDALHLVRAAADFADTIERDAQDAATKQVARAEQEIREAQLELQRQEAEVTQIRSDTERQRVEILNAARNEAREILSKANRESSQELRDSEARGARLLEQSRHQATELTNATRAEVEQTLEWARAQAEVIVQRARMGAEQLLAAAGHGEAAVSGAIEAIVRSAETSTEAARPGGRRPNGQAGTSAPPQARPTPPADEQPVAPETGERETTDETPSGEEADRPQS
jgi:F0F1-type ATP synthase membrane subunit b/b'